MNIGQRIKAARTEQGLTQHQLAERAGIRESQVCRWEAGQMPSGPMIYRLALALGVSTDYLFGRQQPEPATGPAEG